MRSFARPSVLLLCLLELPGVAPAAVPLDLERLTPVPADQPIPTQDFFRPVAMEPPVLNRAGTHLAAVLPADQSEHKILVYEIDAKKSLLLGRGQKDMFLDRVQWLGNSRITFHHRSISFHGASLRLMMANIDNLTDSYVLQNLKASEHLFSPLQSPLRPVVRNRDRDAELLVLNTDLRTNGEAYQAVGRNGVFPPGFERARNLNDRNIVRTYPPMPRSEITRNYLADKEGNPMWAVTSRQGTWVLYRFETNKWVTCPVDPEAIDIVGAASEPGQLLVAGPARDGKPRPLQFLHAASGEFGEVLLQDQHYDFNGTLYRSPASGEVLGAYFEKGGPRVYWFNPEYKALQTKLEAMFPKQTVRIIGSDDRHRLFLLATFSDRHPRTYHWVNLETQAAGLVRNSAPWIDPERMQPMQIMQFKTRDGHRLDAYLTLPKGTTRETPAPLVVLCHDGPDKRVTWGFDQEAQFLVHHGYAVLQPNYRGSTGSVGRFPAEVEYDFNKMRLDIADAVKTAIGTGLVDQGRVGTMGSFFGGYLAVAGVVHEPELYRCAVTRTGIFDWTRRMEDLKKSSDILPDYDRMARRLGEPKSEPDKFKQLSPLHDARSIKVPVFVATSSADWNDTVLQSHRLVGEFEKGGVPHEVHAIKGDIHGEITLIHTLEYYDRVIAFLDKNLKPKK